MSILSLFGCGRKTPDYPTDQIKLRDGSEITVTFFAHASLAIRIGERNVYVDPVMKHADYTRLPEADVVLVTHHHSDHFDREAVDELTTRRSEIICDRTSAKGIEARCHTMRPGSVVTPFPGLRIEAVAAYNTTESRTKFHPRNREDCGYVLSVGGSRIYIAGDTEPTPEMRSLKGIDIAFLPVNQPYTMTVDQAVEAVKMLRPAIFYPYHYGQVDEKTDLKLLAAKLAGITEVRIRPME